MRTIIASIMSASLVVAFADTATSGSRAKHRHQPDALEHKYPYATSRLLNERAYQRGEYWEHDSNALIPGTRLV